VYGARFSVGWTDPSDLDPTGKAIPPHKIDSAEANRDRKGAANTGEEITPIVMLPKAALVDLRALGRRVPWRPRARFVLVIGRAISDLGTSSDRDNAAGGFAMLFAAKGRTVDVQHEECGEGVVDPFTKHI
jgi:hypothetical protein